MAPLEGTLALPLAMITCHKPSITIECRRPRMLAMLNLPRKTVRRQFQRRCPTPHARPPQGTGYGTRFWPRRIAFQGSPFPSSHLYLDKDELLRTSARTTKPQPNRKDRHEVMPRSRTLER